MYSLLFEECQRANFVSTFAKTLHQKPVFSIPQICSFNITYNEEKRLQNAQNHYHPMSTKQTSTDCTWLDQQEVYTTSVHNAYPIQVAPLAILKTIKLLRVL